MAREPFNLIQAEVLAWTAGRENALYQTVMDLIAEVRTLRGETTPADVTAAFIEQCEADGRAEKVRFRLRGAAVRGFGATSLGDDVLELLGVSAFLEAPKPEGETGGEQ